MQDYKKDLVSVVIPMFNAEPFIGKMLDCLQEQTNPNWELLIVDDGSSDKSVEIVEGYAASDARIRLIHRTKSHTKGGNTCRNIGLENAIGEFIVFFDADDIIAPYCLKQRLDFIKSNPDIDFAVFPLTGFMKELFDYDGYALGYKNTDNAIAKFIRNTVPFQVVTNIYRKKSLTDNDITWDEQLKSHQDPDFNLLCLSKHLKFKESQLLPDYFWRLDGNPNSVGKKIKTKKHLLTNIYYLDKRVNQESPNGEYESDLLTLTNYLFKSIVLQNDKESIDMFLGHWFFDNYRFLKFKLKIIGYLQAKIKFKSRYPSYLLMLLLCPVYELRFRKHTNIDWVNKQKKLFKELKDKYYQFNGNLGNP